MIHEELMQPGRWDLTFDATTPEFIRQQITERGHILITEEAVDPRLFDDAGMKALSIYTGRVLRVNKGNNDPIPSTMALAGDHITAWLGDANGRGPIIDTLQEFSGDNWDTFVLTILPSAITAGTISNTGLSTVFAKYFAVTTKQAFDEASVHVGAEYRVNNDGTFDSAQPSDLFVDRTTGDITVIAPKAPEYDPSATPIIASSFNADLDASEWVSHIYLLGKIESVGDVNEALLGEAVLGDIGETNPYKDLHGNADATTRVVNDPVAFIAQADGRAQEYLRREFTLRNIVTLDTDKYRISGECNVGDTVFVYAPPQIVDNDNILPFAGSYIHPKAIRVFGRSWPVTQSMGVYYRDKDGNYVDLSPFIAEEATIKITVGDSNRSPFDSGAAGSVAVNMFKQPANAFNTPGKPTHVTPIVTSVYQSDVGDSFGQAQFSWIEPLNTDLSSITDGSHYVVRYRRKPAGAGTPQTFVAAKSSNASAASTTASVISYASGVAAVASYARTFGSTFGVLDGGGAGNQANAATAMATVRSFIAGTANTAASSTADGTLATGGFDEWTDTWDDDWGSGAESDAWEDTWGDTWS